ncbi:DUF3500 domain-containing protein [Gordonia terrae]|uniref:DUF3500 domain-containing protein n=1 Tax=Gordonia terrae TaxID=2055 RepID=UPI00346D63EC
MLERFSSAGTDSSAWEIQFGGHHLGINATLDGSIDEIIFAPTHLGIQPAVYTAGDGTEVQQIAASLDETYVNWSGATTYDMTQGDGIYFQISGPDVYIEFAAQQGSAGADVDGVTTSGWGHVHTIYRDPIGDYAGSVTQQAATGMGSGGPGGGQPPVGAGPTRG